VTRVNRYEDEAPDPSPLISMYRLQGEWWILMSKVWLVTGSASGLGRNIAEAVLASGDSPRRNSAAVQVAIDTFGRFDVAVNNAGYGDFAPFEQLSS
jgi:NAD(P)-dependent dehydrogenase (short-subunit alcohol dehydrogenase family)